jgi:NitT/TauT family transport system substrate-binding protein
MRTSTRRLIWLLLVTTAAAAVWISIAKPYRPSMKLFKRTPLVGIVPAARPTAPLPRVPDAGTAGEYVPTDRIVTVEISEYAGYAGIIVANGGLEPSEDSLFFRDHNFRVRLSIREEQDFTNLNAGRLGASMTTADVVAIYGANLNAVVPVLVGFSRGADGIVTRREITSFDGLKGKVVATAQFTEAEFLVRYLATHTGVGVKLLESIDAPPDPNRVNLVFAESAFDACDMLLGEMVLDETRLSACSAWEPRTSATVQRSGGAAHFLMTNRNLFIVADVLAVNRGLAEHHPEMVAGLVDGILSGNKMLHDSPEAKLSEIATALNWTRDKTRSELNKVQLATMPDNLEFFSGAASEIGSFAHIYQSALSSYGDLVSAPAPVLSTLDMRALKDLEAAGRFPTRAAPIERLRSLVQETDPVVSLPVPEVVPTKHVLPDAGGPPASAAPGGKEP